MQDLAFPDGRISLDPQQELIAIATSGTSVVTRIAAGNIAYVQAVSSNFFYTANITAACLRKTGFGEDTQNIFGGAGIPASAEYQGRPDTIQSMATGQPITPRTAFKIKGIQLLSFDVIYQVIGAPLTTHTCQVNTALYTNGNVAAITNNLASNPNGLTTAISTNVAVVNVPVPNQPFLILPDQDQWIEINVVTAAGGTYNIWGVDALINYNYN